MATMVEGHSWLDLPASRYPTTSRDGYCILYDNGTQVTPAVCGKDAQGADLKLLRPNTYLQSPCFYPAAFTYNNAPTAVMSVDNTTLCVMWGANAHDKDATRDAGGGVRLSISSNVVNPTQAEFDQMIIARIPYDHFGGVKIQLPALPVGEYLLQFYWDWPTGSADHLFISCSNLSILAKGDSRLVSQQSVQYGMGLPADFRPYDLSAWRCNPSDQVWSNASIVTTTSGASSTTKASTTSSTSSTSSNPTSSSSTPAPSDSGNPNSPSAASMVGGSFSFFIISVYAFLL